MVERFPFGHRRFSTEIIPLLERAKALGAKTCCSLRNIVMAPRQQARHDGKICELMNRYFDQLLIHADPQFIPLEQSFSRVADLNCEVHYTGYVVPERDSSRSLQNHSPSEETPMAQVKTHFSSHPSRLPEGDAAPFILVSIGGGQRGHELLETVAHASRFLEDKLPHRIQMFTGTHTPKLVYRQLMAIAKQQPNLEVQRRTPELLQSMARADLSISTAGYHTTLSVLQTGVRSLLFPATSNGDQKQHLRSHRLEALGMAKVIYPKDLTPKAMAFKIMLALHHKPNRHHFHLRGVEITAVRLSTLIETPVLNCA